MDLSQLVSLGGACSLLLSLTSACSSSLDSNQNGAQPSLPPAEASTPIAAAPALAPSAPTGGAPVEESQPPTPQPVAAAFEPASSHAGRLTPDQYRASLQTLFGQDVPLPETLDAIPLSGNSELKSSSIAGINQLSSVSQFEQAAYDVAEWAFADDARQGALGLCVPASPTDPCIGTSLAQLGQRIWRRPLTTEEQSELEQLVVVLSEQLGSAESGLEYALAALLQSPHFLYRVERGTPLSDGSGWYQLGAFELATRLAYGLTGTTPDDALLAAAAGGALNTTEGLSAEAARLQATELGTAHSVSMLEDFMRFGGLETLAKQEDSWTPALQQAMEAEARGLARAAVESGDLLSVFTSDVTWINQTLAEFYGVDFPSDAAPEDLVSVPAPPGRMGILTSGAILARYGSADTSNILRGQFIRNGLLCGTIPDPPPDLPEVEPREVPAGLTHSRAEAVIRLETSPCSACHIPMDPLGFAFDGFDLLGRVITEEHGVPIRTDGTLVQAGFEQAEIEFDGPLQLTELLVNSPLMHECLVKNLFARVVLRETSVGEAVAMAQLTETFVASQFNLSELIQGIVVSDAFRFIVPRSL